MNYKELEKYIRQLFNQFFNKYNLSVDDKNDVIQNTMLKLYTKELDGTLVGSVVENKNYIFITLRNYVYQSGNKKKNNVLQPIDTIDVPSNTPEILDLMNFQQQKDIILTLLQNKPFNQLELDLITDVFNGYRVSELHDKYGMTETEMNSKYSTLKVKIKNRLFKTYKYKVIYPNKEIYCKTQKELLSLTKISPDTWKNYKRLGKLNFPKYQIQIL